MPVSQQTNCFTFKYGRKPTGSLWTVTRAADLKVADIRIMKKIILLIGGHPIYLKSLFVTNIEHSSEEKF
jgi:hypothetical protein